MKAKPYRILLVTFGVQVMLFAGMLLYGVNQLGMALAQALVLLLPMLGYGVAAYEVPVLSKLSAVPKMTVVTVSAIALAFASEILIVVGWFLYFHLRYGGFPLGWGRE